MAAFPSLTTLIIIAQDLSVTLAEPNLTLLTLASLYSRSDSVAPDTLQSEWTLGGLGSAIRFTATPSSLIAWVHHRK